MFAFPSIRNGMAILWVAGFVAGLSGCNDTPAPPPIIVTPAPPVTPEPPTTPPAVVPPVQTVETPPAAGKSNSSLESWPKPAVALFITGQQLGYIEPCGCTGLENQKGGLARRHTLLKQLAGEKGWPVVPLDVGSQVRRFGKQSEIKFQRTAEGLRAMGYRAVAFGADDLRLSVGDLLLGTNPDDKPSIFTGANVALLGRDFQPEFQVIEAGGKKIGAVGLLGDSFEQKLQGDELIHQPALEGLKASCTKLKEANCDYHVLLAHATLDESKKLAQEVPIFDLVVSSGGGGLPSGELEEIDGTKAKLLKVSHKAMHVAVIGLFDNAGQPVGNALRGVPLSARYASVPLDAKLADSPQMLKLLADYQAELQALGLDDLGLKRQPHPTGRKFAGSAKCGECHTKAYEIWAKTPHAHATESLVHPPNTRGDIARHFDPECLSCHVTGWEPQKMYPFDSGYLSLEKTPEMQHNGCENCHGPGAAHALAESGEGNPTPETLVKLREQMKLPIAGSVAENKCRECHDEDNSPEFNHKGFAAYWKEVEHKGKD